MASRKEQKEQARAQRLAKEQELAAKKQRQRRIQILGGVVVLAIVIVGVAIAISSGGGGSSKSGTGATSKGGGAGSISDFTGLQSGAAAKKTSKYVSNLLNGIPQNGTVLGKPSAKVTFQYFGDLQCPICRDFTMQVLPEFITKQVRTGSAKLDYKSFCTATCNDFSESEFNTQQVAAYAAGKQNQFWDYAELFYHEQGAEGSPYMNETFLSDLAKQTPGLDISKWQTDRKDPTLLSQVQADGNLALKDNIDGTPTLIAEGPKGEEPVANGAVPTYSELVSAIKAVS
jgi:protein-disulfide isomerase